MAKWTELIPAIGREMLRSHIGVGHEHLLGSAGRHHSKPQNVMRAAYIDETPQSPYEFVAGSVLLLLCSWTFSAFFCRRRQCFVDHPAVPLTNSVRGQ